MADSTPSIEQLLTTKGAAAALRISHRHCWQLIKSGKLKCVRLGRAVRIDPADLRACIESAKESSATKAESTEPDR